MIQYIQSLALRTYIGGLLFGGALLRLWDITKSNIWHDEAFSVVLSQYSPAQIIARTARDVHPPLYYLCLHYWTALFGTSELAVRSLSAAATLAIIPITYLLVKELWSERAGRLAALFVTIGPLFIRYGQEGRMYGLVALLIAASTYAVVKALNTNQTRWWGIYALTITAAIYTHYYAIFIVITHILYALMQSSRAKRSGIFSPYWWGANVLVVALYAPWLPSLYSQVSRVQANFWILPTNAATIPDTLLYYVAYIPHSFFPIWFSLIAGLLCIVFMLRLLLRYPDKNASLLLFISYSLVGPIIIYLASFHQPIYLDRYFTYAAVGMYGLIAAYISLQNPRRAAIMTSIVIVLAGIGIAGVHGVYTHKIKQIDAYIEANYQPGDAIIAGEMGVFFDFNYYDRIGEPAKVWLPNGPDGHNETSVIYDRQDETVIRDLHSVQPTTGRVWVIGTQNSSQDYFNPQKIPANWIAIGPRVVRGVSLLQEYQVLPRNGGQVAVQ